MLVCSVVVNDGVVAVLAFIAVVGDIVVICGVVGSEVAAVVVVVVEMVVVMVVFDVLVDDCVVP